MLFHRFIFFSTTIGLMKGSRTSRRISRKAWLQRNLCTSGGVETSLRAPPCYSTPKKIQFCASLSFTCTDCVTWRNIFGRTPALRIIPWIFHGECFRNLWNLLNDQVFQFIFTILRVFSELSLTFFFFVLIIIIFFLSSNRYENPQCYIYALYI